MTVNTGSPFDGLTEAETTEAMKLLWHLFAGNPDEEQKGPSSDKIWNCVLAVIARKTAYGRS